jgi:peptidoglycan/xylan/chitin deacetylase (PgdA/CDA1 family)
VCRSKSSPFALARDRRRDSSLAILSPTTHATGDHTEPDDHLSQKSEMLTRRAERGGLFVVSLDFELYWGVRDMPNVEAYIPNLVGGRVAVGALLDLFTKYGIHATWATVGFLFADDSATLRELLPRVRPAYLKQNFSPYGDLPAEGARETFDSIFFAPSLIRLIGTTENQEIATHTFSHYYCLEEGQDIESFKADLDAACEAARRFGFELKSLVFPRNQCRPEYLDTCVEAGIIAYRGNPDAWFYRPVPDEAQGKIRRLARLLDIYFPLCWRTSHALSLPAARLPVNVCASRFLRSYMPALRRLETLKLERIKREMTAAARDGRMYHLWWHPHNFGVNTEPNLRFLTHILDHYQYLNAAYGMVSANIREAAERSLLGESEQAELRRQGQKPHDETVEGRGREPKRH